ncbi:MAG: IS1595 family transposase [Solirubrobacteraceae bacterium]
MEPENPAPKPKARDNPQRRKSSEADFSLMEFMRRYPDDRACLDRLWREGFAPDGHHAECPKCKRTRKFHRTKTRASYTCDTCGHHVHPMKGTIFEGSPVSLQLWFYVMYVMASTRCGVSAKQMEREIGVTYKTAHRMMKLIRTHLMTDEDEQPLRGDVEVDETSWGGKPRRKQGETRFSTTPPRERRAAAAAFRESKPTVLGMVERGGRVRARVIDSRHGATLSRAVTAHVNPESILFTDDWGSYKPLRRHYIDHKVINHSAGRYVEGEVYTNTIEGFFGNLKTGMRGAYKKVSPRYLQTYLNEYTWRYNAKLYGPALFEQLVLRAAAGI